MPPRRQPAKAAQKHEMEAFAEKYDTLALIHGDPVDIVFAIMARNAAVVMSEDGRTIAIDDEVALRAADMLMSYRYPRVKAADGNQSRAPVLNFNVSMPAAPRLSEVPVNDAPKRPVLVITEGKK
jgi:hypothetical protein